MTTELKQSNFEYAYLIDKKNQSFEEKKLLILKNSIDVIA